jgi:hypothetical protein
MKQLSGRTSPRTPALHSSTRGAGILILALCGLLFLTSCGDIVGGGAGSRTYVMGFTGFPHANSMAAVLAAWDVIASDGDLAVIHEDGGIPWQEALDGTAYPASYASWLEYVRSLIPPGHAKYLAVTPISSSRDGLALYRGDGSDEPLPPPWNTYMFDEPDVMEAFANHCLNMIAIYDPDYFAFAIEANMLAELSPGEWQAFMTLVDQVYADIRSVHPFLPIFATIQADYYYNDVGSQIVPVSELLFYCDVVAVSSYAFSRFDGEPGDMPGDYFTAFANLSPGKPFAIAETAWPAEPVDLPYPIYIPATEATQQDYVERLLADCDELSAAFICWFLTRDFDDYWESDFQYLPDAGTVRYWKDCGLYDGVGLERPALASWREALEN